MVFKILQQLLHTLFGFLLVHREQVGEIFNVD